jgi:hypothetical protein
MSVGLVFFSALTFSPSAFSSEVVGVVSPVVPGLFGCQSLLVAGVVPPVVSWSFGRQSLLMVGEKVVATRHEYLNETVAVNLSGQEQAGEREVAPGDGNSKPTQMLVDENVNAGENVISDDSSVRIIFDGNSSEQVKAREKKISLLLSTVLNLSNYVKLKDDEWLTIEREHLGPGASAAAKGSDSGVVPTGKSTGLDAASAQAGEPCFILRKYPRNAAYLKATDAKLRVEFAQEYEEWLWGQQWSAIRKFLQDELSASGLKGRLAGGADLGAYGLALQLQSDLENGASLSIYKSFVGAPRRLAFASQFFADHNNNLKEPQLKQQAKRGSLGDAWLRQAVMDAAQLSYLVRKAKLKAVVLSAAAQGNADSLSFENRQINFLLDHQLEQKIVFEELASPLFPQVALEKH